jgi:spermidine/putrescine transport system permease protein
VVQLHPGEQFVRSFVYAGIATVLALAISYPLAYFIAFKAGRWRNLMLILVVAPFFCSFLVRTYAWKTVLADTGWVNTTLSGLGILPDDRILNTPIAVVTGITYNFLPFMILPLYAALERIDHRLIEAASDLYASPFTGFRKVTVPLSMPGVVAGTLLTFIPAAGDYINAELLGSQKDKMIGNVIDSQFIIVRDYPTASALSFMLMSAILVLVFIYIRRAGTEDLV